MRRGDIYYITRRDTIGAEIKKTRPAVIVSHDTLNRNSRVLEVVYLTCHPKNDSPTHVMIYSTGKASTVLCEQIDTVSTYLVGGYCGTCTAKEMADIDAALSLGLGLKAAEDTTDHQEELEYLRDELERVVAERDRYAKMLDYCLGEA